MKNTAKIGGFVFRFVDLLDEALCKKILFDLVRRPICRICKKPVPERHLKRYYNGKVVYCKECNSQFNAQAGTILAGTKLFFKQVLLILIMADLNFKTGQIAKRTGVKRHTIARWRHKLTELKNG
ncbi:MAG: hypothetical protein U9Q84_00450 [Thermodesulfobacteriota bacterium]|nr:hypothetical protein [Thermodesulfobacteriota bacterium]